MVYLCCGSKLLVLTLLFALNLSIIRMVDPHCYIGLFKSFLRYSCGLLSIPWAFSRDFKFWLNIIELEFDGSVVVGWIEIYNNTKYEGETRVYWNQPCKICVHDDHPLWQSGVQPTKPERNGCQLWWAHQHPRVGSGRVRSGLLTLPQSPALVLYATGSPAPANKTSLFFRNKLYT